MANESALSGPARAPSSADNLTSEVVNSGKRRARNALSPSRVRFHVDPRDVPPEKAARRLPLTLEEFNALWPKLRERAFQILIRRPECMTSKQLTRGWIVDPKNLDRETHMKILTNGSQG
jgi:hypothetical protein